ncbi:DNA end-binding protein Ku [Halopseudomonas sabulinigri]|uniref:Non-homologous end joining protein Ku n=1 Tax=Halopseudomonas sabulinigri TaxID=472181 RepID=A0A1H1PDE8_9GAMM|nr:Ku protein [Halopseudomonas sabulinigri]SDS09153.1 DNA end-binding protein Ku [Halopseudomonas sabulinigri]
MARAIWKGAISFGLVHIPVALVSATRSGGVDFDWLDERSMDPVGYKRINKRTGKEIESKHVVKGVQYEKGRYVVLSDDEISAAHPEATQTLDIFAFVERAQIPLLNIQKPYFLNPEKRGQKVYALLRETLIQTDRVALANVVIRSRARLAALMPLEDALVVVLLRWPSEVRSLERLDLNETVREPKLNKKELDMAKRLVSDMEADWSPDEYQDTFVDEIMALVEKKAKSGKLKKVSTTDSDQGRRSADVVDLTELLKQSLKGGSSKAKTSRSKSRSNSKSDDAGDDGGRRKTSHK